MKYILGVLLLAASSLIQAQQIEWKFDFGTATVEKGYVAVTPADKFSDSKGYGFDLGTIPEAFDRGGKNALTSDGVCGGKPFYFSVNLPEGNYNVKMILGDAKMASLTTVRAESRRLMLEHVATKKGEFSTQTFTVNIRNHRISSTDTVKIKPREIGKLNWDNKLTLEFNDEHPSVVALEITKADVPTVFLCGNSTVVDQDNEPWCGWGQMFTRFFGKGVAIANYAESGETASTFIGVKRLAKLLTQMKKGDYIFMEFGHNDQKQKGEDIGPFTSYKKTLKQFIAEARKRGATPVIVTSMHRRNFDGDGRVVNTLGDYPEAARQVAAEEKVALIDLNAMSKTLYEAWGPETSIKAFVHYPAGTFEGQNKPLADNTHFNSYGGYELAKCIVEGAKKARLGFLTYLRSDYKTFDPAKPDDFEKFHLPLSPFASVVKPDGN